MALLNVLDVSTYQWGLDLKKARSELDLSAIYIKLGGDNAGRYVAPHYAAQVDQARAAGYPHVGHYWIPGRREPLLAADYFVRNLRHFDPSTDFVVLDNESLDEGRFYSDRDADAWVARVTARLKIPAAQVIVYFPAGPVLREHTWPLLERRGVSVLVASYGRNTGRRDHEPVMGGRFGGVWAAHQYTSQGRMPGWAGPLDLNVFKSSFFDAWKPKPAAASAPALPSLETVKLRAGRALQKWAHDGGEYRGPIDGVLGTYSWRGVQAMLAKRYGYTGRIDGEPGELTYGALQRLARAKGGYTGTVTGVLGRASWVAIAKALA